MISRLATLAAEGKSEYAIAKELGITRHEARKGVLEWAQAKGRQVVVQQKPSSLLEFYDAACRALTEASTINDVLPLLDQVEHFKLHARKVNDKQLLGDAAVFQHEAERRLGQIIVAAKEAGHFLQGHRSKSSNGELLTRATLAEVGVDKKLSVRAQRFAAQDDATFKQTTEILREQVVSGGAVIAGQRAVMANRQQPADDLDFAPTPPWATRALMKVVLPRLVMLHWLPNQIAWEPACGAGHMAEVLSEFFGKVWATDIHDYGYEDCVVGDFLDDESADGTLADWIITNPPFGDKAEAFALRALSLAKTGVALFVQLRWLETIGRYENLFKDHPPTLIAFFAERVNLCMGRWEPDGTTATAYIWLVWVKGMAPRAPLWIPPGQRQALTYPDDVERFTAHPVKKKFEIAASVISGMDAAPEPAGDATAPQLAPAGSLSSDIPEFLQR